MLADSGAAWTDVVARHNSGTYNNQYVVVDLKRFRPGQVLPAFALAPHHVMLPSLRRSRPPCADLGVWQPRAV